MKLQIPANITQSLGKLGLSLKKHSPEILVAAGVVGTVASTVLACKATTKLSGILEESKENLDQIKGYVEENGYSEQYTEKDSQKDFTIIYAQTGLKLVKLYGPSVILGALSLTSIIASHRILTTRNASLGAAYAAVSKGFKEYRGRVIERFGEGLDRELKYNIKEKEIEETVVNEDGSENTIKKTVKVIDPNSKSPFARVFDETCPMWERDWEHNRFFLDMQQKAANDILHRRGYLFLNEVYEMLGFDKTPQGHVVGWYYDKNNSGHGDNFVDFGYSDINDENCRLFINGKEKSVWLDFNVDTDNLYEIVF
jgi:hypothetical protein